MSSLQHKKKNRHAKKQESIIQTAEKPKASCTSYESKDTLHSSEKKLKRAFLCKSTHWVSHSLLSTFIHWLKKITVIWQLSIVRLQIETSAQWGMIT